MSKSSPTLSPKRDIYCSYCGQGFKRDEHLERHILTHTNVRPFRCPECRVAFKRKDLLRRHYKTIHVPPRDDDDPASLRTGVVAINRIPIACLNCAQSKTKCDKQASCGRCVKRKLTCERRQFRRSSWKGNPKADVLSSTLNKSPKDEPTQEQHEIETQAVSEMSVDNSNQAWHLYTSSDGTETDLNMGMSAVTVPEITPWTIQSDIADVPLAAILREGEQIQGAEFGQSNRFPISFSTEHNSAIPPNTPTDLYKNVHFDTAVHEEYFDNALMDFHLLFDSSESGLSDLDWSLVQQEPSSLARLGDIPTEPATAGNMLLYQSWPLFQCNSGELNCITARPKDNIDKLEALDDPTIWSICAPPPFVGLQGPPDESRWALQPIDPFVRDRLLAITQHVWRLSKERIFPSRGIGRQNAEVCPWMDRIILLPQTDALHSLLTKYICQDNDQFYLFPQNKALNSEYLLPQSEDKIVAGILILLRIAQVIRSATNPQARGICNGFIEICSSVVDDVVYVKEEITGTAESIEVSVGLLQLLHWSGDPWHMTIVLDIWERHAKVGNNSMLHSWVAVDLEMSVFHDVPPKLDATSIQFPLPAMAVVPQDTRMAMDGWESNTTPPSTVEHIYTSLTRLFDAFMSGQLSLLQDIPATHLRLLLHPLQSLSMRLHQCLDTFSNLQTPGARPSTTISLASKAFIDEHRILLARWRHLATIVAARSENNPTTLASSLALHHIMVLNSLASFPEVERLTRLWTGSGTITPTHSYQSWMRTASPEGLALLMFNCGQYLNVICMMPPMKRPTWWPAALYRVALVLCQAVISINSMRAVVMFGFNTSADITPPDSSNFVFLDQNISPNPEDYDPNLRKFLGTLHGRPVLTSADGNAVMLLNEISVLDHCVAILEQYLYFDESEFARGVCEKLCKLRSRWRQDC
ncbi:hypothetical protein K505DRAFT_348910 [Melanomma pulvis-pyrius CBS 109.77]|uniref:Transcription factor Cmr1 n=1 Tax=Melanomma pulvis-pyrius CBS 109.77 TaxID=1314802 RepID=A0A6A6XFD5_9PLEO|nr:hypothetical protein K505DRAFT_348910 [Melanomma pulvis-pyrius CBS 109.77]